jgi:hypothetical protein
VGGGEHETDDFNSKYSVGCLLPQQRFADPLSAIVLTVPIVLNTPSTCKHATNF